MRVRKAGMLAMIGAAAWFGSLAGAHLHARQVPPGRELPPTTQGPPQQGTPCGGRSANPRTPCADDVEKMMAALPDKAPAKPLKPRKVLVLARAAGYVHSSIPLAAKTVEAMGAKTGAWSATTTYDAADISAANLRQYDALFLDNTTGCFLDDQNDKAATAAR